MGKCLKLVILIVIVFFVNFLNIKALDCSSTLEKGSRGQDVKKLQEILNEKLNCNLEEDGIYGKLTAACLKSYQADHNLEIDGVFGSETCNSLNDYTSTTSDEIVKAVVMSNNVSIRKSPSIDSNKVDEAKLGSVVKIDSEENDWYKIIGEDNSSAYIKKDLVTKNCLLLDISDQKLSFYKNGHKVWTTKVVTGMKEKHDTPIGRYVLRKNNFATSRYLKGTNDDGSKYSAYVNYWMPFIVDRGIGFHDASWRGSDEYNNTTYEIDGSHGCVNMEYDAAKRLYYSIINDIYVIVRG